MTPAEGVPCDASDMSRPRISTGTAITGAGVWHPEHVLDNAELCVAFNEFVRRANAAGANPPLKESSTRPACSIPSECARTWRSDRTINSACRPSSA
jgi:hypothetical protein